MCCHLSAFPSYIFVCGLWQWVLKCGSGFGCFRIIEVHAKCGFLSSTSETVESHLLGVMPGNLYFNLNPRVILRALKCENLSKGSEYTW